MKITVLGSGGWGTALAQLLSDNNHEVTLWSHTPAKAEAMQRSRENPLLPQRKLHDRLVVTSDISCVDTAELVVFATPSFAVRSTAALAAPHIRESAVLVTVSKGIEKKTHRRMSEIIAEETADRFPVVALSGPSHAEEVVMGLPTGCVAACEDKAAAEKVQDAFMNNLFRVYSSPDIVGVELCGALKNVVALCCGICDGMGYGDNTKALLMTRGLSEIARLGVALGAKKETFTGLSGVGDLIVTCCSMHSRNRRCGILIGQGVPPEDAKKQIGMVVEGITTAEAAYALAQQIGIEMPITECIYKVIHGEMDARDAVSLLMERDKKNEMQII